MSLALWIWSRRSCLYPLAVAALKTHRAVSTIFIGNSSKLSKPFVWRSVFTAPSLECFQATEAISIPAPLHCAGCGAKLQYKDISLPGYLPEEKRREKKSVNAVHEEDSEIKEEDQSVDPLVCQRCFSLKHYNTALNISLKSDDYLTHLSVLKDKRALILLTIDVTDYPGSVFPNLNSLISSSSQVLIVANKIDLLPKNTTKRFWKEFEQTIMAQTNASSLADCKVMGVRFISAKTGYGLEELCGEITNSWGNRGDVYLLGCTNVGKSTLFNMLLSRLCGARPGQLSTAANVSAPMATISQWPGTTLGLLSFPLLSVGKVRRIRQQQLRAQQQLYTGLLSLSVVTVYLLI